MQRVGYKDEESQAQDAEIELAKSNCGVDVYPEFGGERLVGLGEVGVVAVQVVDLNDEVLALGLVLLLQSTRLALQLRLQLHDGALSVLGRTSAAPSVQQQQQQQQPFNGRLSGTTRVGRYQKKHSPAHTHPGQRTSFITFVHLQRSMASSLFSLRA